MTPTGKPCLWTHTPTSGGISKQRAFLPTAVFLHVNNKYEFYHSQTLFAPFLAKPHCSSSSSKALPDLTEMQEVLAAVSLRFSCPAAGS